MSKKNQKGSLDKSGGSSKVSRVNRFKGKGSQNTRGQKSDFPGGIAPTRTRTRDPSLTHT